MRTTVRRRLAALSAPLAIGALLLSPATAGARVGGRLVPSSGVMLGAFVADNGRNHQAALSSFEQRVGRRMHIDHRFYSWHTRFPLASDRATARHGRILFVTWQPSGTSLSAIAGGGQDRWLRARAHALARLHRPVMIAFAHEMNGGWYAWGHQPGTFVAAWRRVVRVMRAAGAHNVVWVWSPNWTSVPDESWNAMRRYYPGDAYVDWVSVSAYNRGPASETRRWRQLREMVAPVYRAYGHRKPIMLRETGSVERGGSKARWILTAANDLRRRFPDVAAMVWFNASVNGNDWRVETSRASLRAFRTIARYPWFRV